MSKKHCEHCNDGNMPVPFVFAYDDTCNVEYATYCPMCGRQLEDDWEDEE